MHRFKKVCIGYKLAFVSQCIIFNIFASCDESAASPLIISISPSLNRRPSPGSRREWVCERGGALKQPGLAACDEAHLK